MKYKGSYFSYFLMNTFHYMSLALFSCLISVYLMGQGYKATEVSIVVSSSYVISMLIQPIIGYLNDHYDKKKVNAGLLIIATILGLLFIHVHHIYMIAFVYSLTLAIINGITPIIEKKCTDSNHKYAYIRMWGTIGYAIGSQVAGFVYDSIAPSAIFVCFAISVILSILGHLGMEDDVIIQDQKKKEQTSRKMLFNKSFLIYLVITCLFYGVTNVNSTYLPAMYQDSGLSIHLVSMIIFITTLFELPMIFLSHHFMNKLSNKVLLIMVFLLLIIQFSVYSFIYILPIQILITFATKTVATMIYIMLNLKIVATLIDERYQMTALAIVAMMKSFSSILFQYIGGYFIEYYSYHVFYIMLLIFSLLGILIVTFYQISNGDKIHLFL